MILIDAVVLFLGHVKSDLEINYAFWNDVIMVWEDDKVDFLSQIFRVSPTDFISQEKTLKQIDIILWKVRFWFMNDHQIIQTLNSFHT